MIRLHDSKVELGSFWLWYTHLVALWSVMLPRHNESLLVNDGARLAHDNSRANAQSDREADHAVQVDVLSGDGGLGRRNFSRQHRHLMLLLLISPIGQLDRVAKRGHNEHDNHGFLRTVLHVHFDGAASHGHCGR